MFFVLLKIYHLIRCISKLYAKLQAYAGQRLNQPALQQAAWNFLNKNTTGVYPPAVSVGGTDVLNPITEVNTSAFEQTSELFTQMTPSRS